MCVCVCVCVEGMGRKEWKERKIEQWSGEGDERKGEEKEKNREKIERQMRGGGDKE